MLEVEITEGLVLDGINENMVKDDELVSVEMYFSFYGQECIAYLVMKDLDQEWGSFAMTETRSNLLESFEESIEDPENYAKIKEVVKDFKKWWDKEQEEYK